MGQQRIFWRDTLADRQLNSDYNGGSSAAAINSMGFRQEFRAGVTGSHALRSRPARPNGDHRDNGNIAHYAFPALSVWPLDGHQHSGSRQPEFSRDGSAQPTASHTIGELLNPVSCILQLMDSTSSALQTLPQNHILHQLPLLNSICTLLFHG